MVLVTLAHAKKFAVAHKAPEFQRRVEVDVFAEDKVVGHFWQYGVCWVSICLIRCIRNAVIERMVEVVSNKVATFEKEVNVIWGAALGVVCGGHEGCVFGSAPVQFWCDFAEFFDGVLDLRVDICPFSRWV